MKVGLQKRVFQPWSSHVAEVKEEVRRAKLVAFSGRVFVVVDYEKDRCVVYWRGGDTDTVPPLTAPAK